MLAAAAPCDSPLPGRAPGTHQCLLLLLTQQPTYNNNKKTHKSVRKKKKKKTLKIYSTFFQSEPEGTIQMASCDIEANFQTRLTIRDISLASFTSVFSLITIAVMEIAHI